MCVGGAGGTVLHFEVKMAVLRSMHKLRLKIMTIDS